MPSEPFIYEDFELRLRSNGSMVVEVLQAPYSRGAECEFAPPVSEAEYQIMLAQLQLEYVRKRSSGPTKMQAARSLGQKLYDSLFKDRVSTSFEASRYGVELTERGLRLRLNLAGAPKYMNLPWEFMYDGTRFLTTGVQVPIIRQLGAATATYSPLRVDSPLGILAAACSPTDEISLDVADEAKLLENALKPLTDSGLAHIKVLYDPSLEDVQKALTEDTYHVFHFMGHGGWEEVRQEGTLCFVEDDGTSEVITGERLGVILSDHQSMRLVFANACRGAFASSNHAFSSIAASLVMHGLPAVLAMQFEISDRAAVISAQHFYCALAKNRSVEEAVGEVRKVLFDGDDIEWAVPVLFMQSGDGHMFSSTPGHTTSTLEPSLESAPIDQFLYGKRRPFEPDVVLIEEGSFNMGGSSTDEHVSDVEEHPYEVLEPAFYISRFPVTVGEYRVFLSQTGHLLPSFWDVQEALDLHPVVGISWFDAQAFCDWLAQVTGKPYALPTESQWEKAARGTDERVWPWGNDWDPDKCNAGYSGMDGTKPVDTYFEHASPYEVVDLVGNVWEWCNSAYRDYPYDRFDGREERNPEDARVIRGGSYLSNESKVRCNSRASFKPVARAQYLGFRIAIYPQQIAP